jgi:hypothetical protein
MVSLDTNVVVRLLISDTPKQTEAALQLNEVPRRKRTGYQKLEIVVSPCLSRAPLVSRSAASSGESDPKRLKHHAAGNEGNRRG